MELFRSHMCWSAAVPAARRPAPPQLIKRFEEQLDKNGLDKEVKVVHTGCFGLCEAGPVVIVYPEGAFYSRVKLEDVDEIVSEHLHQGPHRAASALQGNGRRGAASSTPWTTSTSTDKQKRVALRNCGVIDPENIDEYIAFDGYKALAKVLDRNDPRAGHRRGASSPACAAAAARASPPA